MKMELSNTKRGKLIHIVCCDKNNGIGYDGNLLERFTEDIFFFKERTINNIVIMGSKTYQSINCIPLKDRINIVVTSKPQQYISKNGVIFVNNLNIIDELLICNNIYVIGGAQLYQQTINYADTILLTRIDKEYSDVDTYYPEISEHIFTRDFDRQIFGNKLLTLETYNKRSNIRLDYEE